jgi:myo-inositol-1(or 4)-monophosphatase
MDALERRAGPIVRLPKVPSLALRLARVAEGSIDVGLVSANSHDWDLAGGDVILREAGSRLTDLGGEPVRYNQAEPIHGELLATSERLHPDVVSNIRP